MPSSLTFSHSPLILKRPNNSSADFGAENKSGGVAEVVQPELPSVALSFFEQFMP
jgi:hypothetical protein